MTRGIRSLLRVAALGIGVGSARGAIAVDAPPIQLGPYHGDGTPVFIDALAALPESRTLYAGGDDGLYRSVDGGGHWTMVLADSLGVLAVAVNPDEPSTIYAGAFTGLFRSSNSGSDWTRIRTEETFALATDGRGSLYVGTAGVEHGEHGLVLRTADHGESWVVLLDAGLYERITVLAVDSVSPANVYAGTGSFALFRTADAGATWSIVSGIWVGTISSVSIHPGSDATLYAASHQEQGFPENPFHCNVVKSTDFGANWETLTDPMEDCSFSSVAIEPFGRHRILANVGFTLSISNDAGRTFSSITDTPIYAAAYAFDSTRPGHVYVGGVGVSDLVLETGRGIEPPGISTPRTRTLPPRAAR
jgi:photosystem II stability/assembly factor-like uncharacterized protein